MVISSISSLIANEDVNFNLGKSIEENTISKIDDANDKINSKFTILNLDQVDGALVGGASLKSKDFSKIIDSYS